MKTLFSHTCLDWARDGAREMMTMMTMLRSRKSLLLLFALSLASLTGCKAKLQAQLRDRDETIRSLDGQLANMRLENERLQAERDRALADAKARQSQPQEASAPKQGNKKDLDFLANEIGSDVKVRNVGGRISIGIPSSVSFAPGSTQLSPEGQRVLGRVARVLQRDFAGRRIYVEGHTDRTPLKKTKSKYKTNRRLSAMRADAVATYLGQHQVPESKIVIVGYGPYKPVSQSNLAANRRVEVVIGD